MTVRDPATREALFRREALEHRAQPRRAEAALRRSPGWARHGFWFVVAAPLAAIASAWLTPVARYAHGIAAPGEGGHDRAVIAVFPVRWSRDLHVGSRMRLDTGDAAITPTATIEAVDEQPIDAATAGATLPRPAAIALRGPQVRVRARIDPAARPPAGPGPVGVEVRIGSRPLLVDLLPARRASEDEAAPD